MTKKNKLVDKIWFEHYLYYSSTATYMQQQSKYHHYKQTIKHRESNNNTIPWELEYQNPHEASSRSSIFLISLVYVCICVFIYVFM